MDMNKHISDSIYPRWQIADGLLIIVHDGQIDVWTTLQRWKDHSYKDICAIDLIFRKN